MAVRAHQRAPTAHLCCPAVAPPSTVRTAAPRGAGVCALLERRPAGRGTKTDWRATPRRRRSPSLYRCPAPAPPASRSPRSPRARPSGTRQRPKSPRPPPTPKPNRLYVYPLTPVLPVFLSYPIVPILLLLLPGRAMSCPYTVLCPMHIVP